MQAPQESAPSSDWRAQAKPLLGVKPDTEIARDLGVSVRKVRYLRQSMQISPPCKARWGLSTLQQLGVVPDSQLAEKLGLSVSAIKRKRQQFEAPYERRGMPPEAAALLGKVSDMEVAQRFGRSYDTARLWRIAANMPPVITKRPWTASEIAQLGTMPDIQLARVLSRRPRDVKAKREKLGIEQRHS